MLFTKIAALKLSLAALLLVGAAAPRAEAAAITWFKDLDKASEVAKKTNQPMMIEFWTDWCAACKVMEEKTYTDPKLVAAVNDKIIPVRIHFHLQQDLAREYNVPALPYMVFHEFQLYGADAPSGHPGCRDLDRSYPGFALRRFRSQPA